MWSMGISYARNCSRIALPIGNACKYFFVINHVRTILFECSGIIAMNLSAVTHTPVTALVMNIIGRHGKLNPCIHTLRSTAHLLVIVVHVKFLDYMIP